MESQPPCPGSLDIILAAHRVSLDHFQREKDEWAKGVDPERKETLHLKK